MKRVAVVAAAEAEKRGYIVIAPAAPDEGLFFQDGDRLETLVGANAARLFDGFEETRQGCRR
jgi:hypothetical protein